MQIKAVANLPKADFVNIEPSSEDDWEILELNSEHAEEAILKQVLNFPAKVLFSCYHSMVHQSSHVSWWSFTSLD